MVVLYLPKQLYKKENMIKNASIVSEGISYYYVDGYKKVYRHITDNKEEDKEDAKVPLTDKIKEKVKKLAPNPSPATIWWEWWTDTVCENTKQKSEFSLVLKNFGFDDADTYLVLRWSQIIINIVAPYFFFVYNDFI